MDELRPELGSWRWAGRAIFVGLVLLLAGGLIGGLLSLWTPIAGMAVGGTLSVLVAAPWAFHRIGSAGLAAALLGVIAIVGASVEVRHAWVVTRVEIVEVSSVELWPKEAKAIKLPAPLLRQPKWRGSASWTTRSGKNSHTNHRRVAVPLTLNEDGPVVAFDCFDGSKKSDPSGPIALSYEEWTGTDEQDCERPARESLKKLAKDQRAVAPGATNRFVRVFKDEQALRDEHELEQTALILLNFFAFYVLCVLIFQRVGTRSYNKG